MTKEVARRAHTNAEIEQITSDYEVVRLAGVWNRRPFSPPRQPFPFLALSQSRTHLPLKSVPLFRYDTGVTSDQSIFPFPHVEAEDNYNELAEEGLVQIVGRWRQKSAQVWVPRRLGRLEIHPPLMEALDSFMDETGVDWNTSALKETDINENFMTLRAPVPREEITLELGGPPQTVEVSALVAAGLRLAISHTLLIDDIRKCADARPELFKQIEE